MALGWRKEYSRYKSYFLNILVLYRKKHDLQMFMEILLSLGTIMFFAIFALKPTLITIAGLWQEIKGKEEEIAKMDTKIQNLGKAQQILNSEGASVAIIESSIPVGPQPEFLIHQIDGVALTSSVKILGVSVNEIMLKGTSGKTQNPTQTPSELSALPKNAQGMAFSASTTATYQNLFSFLQNLENLRMPVKIDVLGINLSKSEQGSSLNLVISGRAIYIE